MKRVEEKVKDIVDVRPFTYLNDFAADPTLTLAGYHFTDITADLMAKWLDRLSDVRAGRGEALALAGFRGVGKSHFLAVIGALVSKPDLRSGVTDPHVRSAVDRLSRRHNPVAFVRRGSSGTLVDELKQALAIVLDRPPDSLPDSPEELLAAAAGQGGDLPLVVMIDTDLGRDSRVSRDDGPSLSQIAMIARELGIFVGVALDDDISGADGPNSSISSSFSIDYLDQEHLYKVVGANIFAKQSKMLPVLQDIYSYYRSALPGFRWSEQRFSSLYPLHPATLEIAPIIRLYIHDFALLGFAAEAGLKILGRPANSLIGLDEVFDGVEARLRSVSDLVEAFVSFDRLQSQVVSKTPVHFRLPAKLVLKGFFLLSLDGRGSTASDIAAAMMIVEEPNASSPVLDVSALLDSFAAALPDVVEKAEGSDREARYRFKLTSKLDIGDILSALVADVPEEVIWGALLRQTAEKFSDIEMTSDLSAHPTYCKIDWRGGIRRGSVAWSGIQDPVRSADKGDVDWTIVIDGEHSPILGEPDSNVVRWQVAQLTAQEKDTIRRHHLLQTNAEAREQLGDAVTTAAHAHSIAVEKVWQRVMIADARLIDGDVEYPFEESVRSAHSLGQLLAPSLAPIFANRFTQHPSMPVVLDAVGTSLLISSFLSNNDLTNPEVQRLAEACAAPLGLAVKQGDVFVPAGDEAVSDLAAVKEAFEGVDTGADSRISFSELSVKMQAAPFGYTREVRQLFAAALVAQRRFEFVTSSGDRINHRSLDLRIVWDDIVGLARPLNELYSAERLVSWARLLSGNPDIKAVDQPGDRALIVDALTKWRSEWRENGILDKFDSLSDEYLSAGIWRTAASLRKSYGAIAETAGSLVNGDLSVEQCLQAIADLFSDIEAEFEKKKDDLRQLTDFIAAAEIRNMVMSYLSVCELTDDQNVERCRQAVMNALARDNSETVAPPVDELESLWLAFRTEYTNYYVQRHDAVMSPTTAVPALKEILDSDTWSTFESFCENRYFDRPLATRIRAMTRELRQLYCLANAGHVLETSPSCSCSFELRDYERLAKLADDLRAAVQDGIKKFKAAAVSDGAISSDTDLKGLSGIECRLLNIAAGNTTGKSVKLGKGLIAGAGLADDLDDWDREIEQLEVFANT